jgi:hypothetical protein
MLYGGLVSANLDPGLPLKDLYDNLRRLVVFNEPERCSADVADVYWINIFILSRQSLGGDY